ncbi:hypothetical protein ACLM5H_05050 [Fredinandcohnia humi]
MNNVIDYRTKLDEVNEELLDVQQYFVEGEEIDEETYEYFQILKNRQAVLNRWASVDKRVGKQRRMGGLF